MKFLKKVLMLSLFAFASLCFINMSAFGKSADAAPIEETVFQYVSISRNDLPLTTEHFKTVETTSYAISNDSLTINFKPFTYEYSVDLAIYENNFKELKTPIEIEKDDSGEFVESFEIYNAETQEYVTYYYRIIPTTGVLNIYDISPTENPYALPLVASSRTSLFNYTDTPESRTITYTYAYNWKSGAPDSAFTFTVRTSNTSTRTYTFNLLRPKVEFANDNTAKLLKFTCAGLDAGESGFVNETLRRELAYNNVQLDFLNNNYTAINPLYFKINYNGFTYDFELYSEEYDSEQLLFVNYIDTEKESNNKYLATGMFLDSSETLVVDTNNKVFAMNGSDFNYFSMFFTKTGRYGIEVYDSTYLLGLNEPNYYETSFYIRDPANTAFENIYIIAQTQDDEGKDIEYIVSTSTLNHSVKTTVKNLNNLGTDGSGQAITLDSVIDKIEIKKTTFGGSTNIPTFKAYSVAEINSLLKNGDFVLTFDDDAYYEVSIYKKGSTTDIIYYEFTIVKHAKTTFTIPLVDENGEPIFDEKGKQKSDTYEATTPFKTEIIDYSKNILSDLDLKIQFSISSIPHAITLDKTYINNYTISYGVQQVSIEQFEPEVEEGEKKVDNLSLNFMGVGELTVEVSINGGEKTVYKLNYEEKNFSLTFTEYGTYTVRLVDSMGTETTAVYSFQKKLNTSAIALLVLSGIIATVIVLFVLKARGKVATR